MRDRRSNRRKKPKYYLKVINDSTDALAGSMLDLSPEGIMLACRQQIREDDIFSFRMALPDATRGEKIITVAARARWCNKDLDNDMFDFYNAGFEFENTTDENIKTIKSSLRNLLFLE